MSEQRLIDYDKAWTELVYAHEPYAADLIQMMPTIDPETVPIVQELRSINKRLKAVVKVQLEQLREKTSVIDELCEKVADLDEKLYWVTKERDAAIAERDELIRGMKIFGSGCYSCKHFDRSNGKFRAEEPCGVNNNWEWRGIQEAQKDE